MSGRMRLAGVKAALDSFLSRNALLVVALCHLLMPYPLRPGWFTAGAAFVSLAGLYVLVSRQQAPLDRLTLALLTAFLAYDFLFVFEPGFSFALLRAYSFGLLTFVTVALYSSAEGLRRLSAGLLCWLGASVALAAGQYLMGDTFYLPYYSGYFGGPGSAQAFNFFKVTSPLGFNFAKSQFGAQLAFLTPFMLVLAAAGGWGGRLKWAVNAGLAVLLAVSMSRAAWLGVFTTWGAAALLYRGGHLKTGLVFGAVFVAILCAMSLDKRERLWVDVVSAPKALNAYESRAVVTQALNIDVSAKTRVTLFASGLSMLRDYPLGRGAGAFRALFDRYRTDVLKGTDQRSDIAPHNTYVQVLVEKGILGLIAFALVVGRLLYRLFHHGLDGGHPRERAVCLGLLSLLLYGLFHEILPDRMLWIALGMAVAFSGRGDIPGGAASTGAA